jgi:general secretion pathway protein A
MYHEYYNLTSMPFENTPDPRFFFASEEHREALAAIEYTILMRKGFVMITGGIGSGKTTVGRTMAKRCAGQAEVVHVLHGHRKGNEMLKQILRNLDVEFSPSDDHASMLERLGSYLRGEAELEQPIVLLVDEAQTLSDEALEELRLLSNFDTSTQKLIQVVLIGQPELRRRICAPHLGALRQRIAMAKQIKPLTVNNVDAYIAHRLTTASKDPQDVKITFSEEAVEAIHQYTGGVPRMINFVCDNCLLMGYVREWQQPIPRSIVHEVVRDMLPEFNDPVMTAPPVITTEHGIANRVHLPHAHAQTHAAA